MRIDLHPSGLVVDGVLVTLSRREQALVSWLMSHTGVPQSRDTLLTHVWGYREGAHTRTVETTMNRLRAKLEAQGARLPIRTVRGQGWVLEAEVQEGGPFLGRIQEQRVLERWLQGSGRLLTVTGPPGIGKSALVARCLAESAVRIDGAALTGPSDWFRALEAHPQGLLWVDDADGLVETLASNLPARRMVVTSRRPLHHRLEEVLLLGPLSLAESTSLAGQLLERWFPGAGRPDEVLADLGRISEGNPLALELSLRAREVPGYDLQGALLQGMERSMAHLGDEATEALLRLASVPVAIPHALALDLAGSEALLVSLRERSLLVSELGAWRVPGIVRQALLDRLPDVTARISTWLVATLSSVHAAGPAAWGALLKRLDPGRPLLEWAARTLPSPDAAWWAVLALDDWADRHIGLGGPDRRPLLDRVVETGGSAALIRRAREHRRHGAMAAATEDLARASQLHTDPATLHRLQFIQAYYAYNAGDMAQAEQLSQKTVSAAEALSDPERERVGHVLLAQIAKWHGDHPKALEHALAAAAVPGPGAAGLEVLGFVAACLAEVGRDDEAFQKFDALERLDLPMTLRLQTVCERGWTEVVVGRGVDPLDRMREAVDALAALGTHAVRGARMDYAWTLIGLGRYELGLREIRGVTQDMLAAGAQVQAGQGRAFAVAARVALGLPPTAPWMPPETLEGDPVVRALVAGFEGTEEVAVVLVRTEGAMSRRARVLRRLLRPQ